MRNILNAKNKFSDWSIYETGNAMSSILFDKEKRDKG